MKVEITVEVIKETELAVLVTDGDEEVWLPKSHIETDEDFISGVAIEIAIPEWLANEKGLI